MFKSVSTPPAFTTAAERHTIFVPGRFKSLLAEYLEQFGEEVGLCELAVLLETSAPARDLVSFQDEDPWGNFETLQRICIRDLKSVFSRNLRQEELKRYVGAASVLLGQEPAVVGDSRKVLEHFQRRLSELALHNEFLPELGPCR